MAIDAAKRPEIEQHDLAAQLGERDRTGVDPADAARQAGADPWLYDTRRNREFSRSSKSAGLVGGLVTSARPRTTKPVISGNGEQGRGPASGRAIGTHARDLILVAGQIDSPPRRRNECEVASIVNNRVPFGMSFSAFARRSSS